MGVARVLSIAGTDPTGGAGIHADLKSIAASGSYGMGVVTAIVSQNICWVREIFYLDSSVVTAQLEAVSDDVTIDAVKIGMLGRDDYKRAVDAWLTQEKPPVVVLDPVMVATSGDKLIDADAEVHLRALLKHATVVTPNTPELEILAGVASGSIMHAEEAIAVAQQLAAELSVMVAVKGGHLADELVYNHLVDARDVVASSSSSRVNTEATHGTGCSMSSALATRLACGDSPQEALNAVTRWLYESIRHASDLGVGQGSSPINHSFTARQALEDSSTRPWSSQDVEITSVKTGELDQRVNDLQVQPTGRWTTALAQLALPIVEATMKDDFVSQLAEDSLPAWDFTAYQVQDAFYLDQYSRALSKLAASSTDPQQTVFWASCAAGAITAEQELYRSWLSQVPAALQDAKDLAPTPVTKGCTDHLLARPHAEAYAMGAAAVLPCFWLYAEIGMRLVAYSREDHPYSAWLETYRDPGFIESTIQAIDIVENLLDQCSDAEREEAFKAFVDACLWERKFFDQTRGLR